MAAPSFLNISKSPMLKVASRGYLGLDRGRCCRCQLRANRAKCLTTPTKWLSNWRDNRVTFIDHAKGVVTINLIINCFFNH